MKTPFWLNLNTLAAGIIAGLLIYIGLQKIELLTCRLHSKDFQAQLTKADDELTRISSEKNTQQVVTRDRIKVVNRKIQVGNKQAERIEQAAPEPGQCHRPTAKIIMEADA